MKIIQHLKTSSQKIIVGSMCIFSLAGCHTMKDSYTQVYEQNNASIHGVQLNQVQADALGQRFAQTFNQMGSPNFLTHAREMFADDLYVNDTLSIYYHFADMKPHFEGMNRSVSDPHVVIQHVLLADDSVFLHWKMTYTLKLLGSKKTMSSYGISQIKVNPDNKIIFQQDYWDPTNGLYRQLPVIGGVYRLMLPVEK